MNGAVLELEDVAVHYGKVQAVDGVSLALLEGETLGLVGESGCGKSSLARAVAGLAPLSAGRITLAGEDMGRKNRRFVSDRVQLLFQDPAASLSPRMSVANLLAEPLRIRRRFDAESWESLLALSRTLGLNPDVLSRYPHQLSGGQARRVALLRALAAEPRIIVADEPTAGLDVSVQGETLNLLRALKARLKLSYLLISHNLNVVGRVSQRTAIMYLGRIVEIGETAAIFRAQAHPYTRALLSSNLSANPARRAGRIVLDGELPNPGNPPSGCNFHQRCPFVRPRCRMEAPQLARQRDGRLAACHFPLDIVPVQASSG